MLLAANIVSHIESHVIIISLGIFNTQIKLFVLSNYDKIS